MPRRKISEFRSKKIINNILGLDYLGWEVFGGKMPDISADGTFVLKVDQAVKKRFKQGLVYLDVTKSELQINLKTLADKGYKFSLVEPYFKHDNAEERYISFSREREGIVLNYSRHGGVDIETHEDTVKHGLIQDLDIAVIANETGFTVERLQALIKVFTDQYMSLLEINPYIVKDNELKILDVAVEVDSAAELLATDWSEVDFRSPVTKLTQEELNVNKLNKESPASFSLEVINPNGSIFLLLSGGGASVVIADEIFMMGHGEHLANYGEYSGNPSTDETELYTEQVIKLLLKSNAAKKVVLIGGAVANFTDIKNTFKGIVNILEKYSADLYSQDVKFYVRRGGPRQSEGLRAIAIALEEIGILGGVYDPSVSIPAAVTNVVKGLK